MYYNNQLQYDFIEVSDKNYIRLQYVDFPLEFRWRTSTVSAHKFWRLYTGVKLSYLFNDRSYYSDGYKWSQIRNNQHFNRLTTSVYTSVGWNTWNLYFSYGLSPIYKPEAASLEKLNAIEVGLLFYIL